MLLLRIPAVKTAPKILLRLTRFRMKICPFEVSGYDDMD